jgi:preprotein translocase subunit SecD
MRLKEIFTNVRVIILVLFLLFALIAISPRPWHDGAAIRGVTKESAAAVAGIQAPLAKDTPVSRERVIAINNQPIRNAADYYGAVATITGMGVNRTFTLQTDRNLYSLTTRPAYETVILNETELVNVTTPVFNATTNQTVNVTSQELRNKTLQRVIGVADVGLNVYDAPTTNIRQGLDLSGGTRVVLKPHEQVSASDLGTIQDNIKERLNVFGLSDIVVRPATDLSGQDFIVVEIAGANKDDVQELLAKQGKFEARVGNTTVFRGGDKDITYVCRSADCSGIDPRAGCGQAAAGWSCRFRFSISLSPAAAARQAATTSSLSVTFDQGGSYLSQPLDLYLDDQFVDSLRIAADLKGRAVTDIEISGSGSGRTQQEAIQVSLANMKKLQTVLITGSLPVQLDIVKTDSVSPLLGQEFVRNALLVGLLAVLAVVIVVFIRYHDLRVSIPMIITMISEAVLLLGFAAVAGWNLDLSAIAAIIIAIGTGVNDQIIIADETLHSTEEGVSRSWKERIIRAFFIIMVAYLAIVAAMLPLWYAGAGMLRGFAITTIVGVSIGVFITRRAFAAMVENLVKTDEE